MKNVMIILSLYLVLSGKEQKFEGVITWSAQYDPTDTTEQQLLKEHFAKTFILKAKDNDNYLGAEGGLRSSGILWLGDKKKYYSVDPSAKTYKALEKGDWATSTSKPVVTSTGEERMILGYHCQQTTIPCGVLDDYRA
jgi:hypothetical protein